MQIPPGNYTSLVRTHVEYPNALWVLHPPKIHQHDKNIQIRDTKLLDTLKIHSYRQVRGGMIRGMETLPRLWQHSSPEHFQLLTRPSRQHLSKSVTIEHRMGQGESNEINTITVEHQFEISFHQKSLRQCRCPESSPSHYLRHWLSICNLT